MARKPSQIPVQDVHRTTIDEILVQRVYAASLEAVTMSAIARATGLSKPMVQRVLECEAFKSYCATVAEKDLIPVLNKYRARMAARMEKAFTVIDHHLSKNNMQAAIRVLADYAAKGDEKKESADNTIQIVLAGQEATTIDVSNEDNNDA